MEQMYQDYSYLPTSGVTGPLKMPDSTSSVQIADYSKLKKAFEENTIKIPNCLDDLNCETSKTIQISTSAALSLGLPIGSIDSKYESDIFVQEYCKYKDLTENNASTRWGISIRFYVKYKKLSGKADFTSLVSVAASTQLNFAQADAVFEVQGLHSAEITKCIPTPSKLDVQSYLLYNEAVNKIKSLIWQDGTAVTPIIVSVLGKQK